MLSREDKAALIDMSMEAEELCYCKTIMEVIINLIKEKDFLHFFKLQVSDINMRLQ